MKLLIAGTIFLAAMFPGIPIPLQSTQQLAEMQVLAGDVFKDKVKVYDYTGNLLKEMTAEDVANAQISVADYFVLDNSAFAFKYLGDYYYLRD
ncbi:MAG: hypothetical protein ABJP45_06330 [Cyclobacteriaceae bacterium]